MYSSQQMDEYREVFNPNFVKNNWDKCPISIKLPPTFKICSENNLKETLCSYVTSPSTIKKNNELAQYVTAINDLPPINWTTLN